MTSNIGARFIQKRGTMGFQGSSDVSRVKMEEMVMNAVRQTFNPEFINRLDEIIVFDELGDEELLDVLQLQIDQINATMSNHGFIVRLVDEAKQWIVNKTCADRSYGARPLRRALQKHVEDPLSEALIQGQLADASLVEMFVDGADLNFRSISIDDEGNERVNDMLLTQ
jgi:ATP-dependent Clp protease ATP-binding subunit ClpC